MAMTADGKIATANRAIGSFGSRRDHDHLLALRATADAVLCGASTAGGENISLGPGPARFRKRRLRRGLAEFNLRIVASGSAGLPPQSSLFEHRFSPILVLTTRQAAPEKVKALQEVADEVVCFGTNELDLEAALQWLHERWKVDRLICEGGGELNDAMFRAGLVDELHLTVCPKIFGGRQAPTIVEGAGFARLTGAADLELRSRRLEGREMFLVYDVLPSPSWVSTQRAMSHSTSDRRLK
jgi:riboflavin-specific deaminase-like protein